MFDRMAGVHDVETSRLQRRVFDARDLQFRPGKIGAGRGNAFVGLDRNDFCLRRHSEKRMRETAPVRADIQH